MNRTTILAESLEMWDVRPSGKMSRRGAKKWGSVSMVTQKVSLVTKSQ